MFRRQSRIALQPAFCTITQQRIRRGEPIVRLDCRHVFKLSAFLGYTQYLRSPRIIRCPNCRRPQTWNRVVNSRSRERLIAQRLHQGVPT